MKYTEAKKQYALAWLPNGFGMPEHIGVEAKVIDRHGPGYTTESVINGVERLINSECYFSRKAKDMTEDASKAITTTEKVTTEFQKAAMKFMETETAFVENSRKASGAIREAADKLSGGLARVEKAANFDRLEKYVELLERAADAMTKLADLESKGKLEKIAAAIR